MESYFISNCKNDILYAFLWKLYWLSDSSASRALCLKAVSYLKTLYSEHWHLFSAFPWELPAHLPAVLWKLRMELLICAVQWAMEQHAESQHALSFGCCLPSFPAFHGSESLFTHLLVHYQRQQSCTDGLRVAFLPAWAVRLAGDSRDAHRKQLSNGNKFYFSWITCSALWSFPRQLRGGMTDLFSVF